MREKTAKTDPRLIEMVAAVIGVFSFAQSLVAYRLHILVKISFFMHRNEVALRQSIVKMV